MVGEPLAAPDVRGAAAEAIIATLLDSWLLPLYGCYTSGPALTVTLHGLSGPGTCPSWRFYAGERHRKDYIATG